MDLEIIIVNKSNRKKLYHLHVESKKNVTNELLYKKETDS